MNHLVRPLLVTLAASFASPALAAGTRQINSPFRYQFFGTDVASWANGTKSGLVRDTRGTMAEALDELVSGARHSLDMAAYGIQDQTWLMRNLRRRLDEGVEVRLVVDQQRGELGDWSPANFTYPHTARLAGILGDDRITPDLNPNGRPRAGTIMHDKFVVVDRRKVWLGSANFSATCMGDEYNANVALLVDSPDLARIYGGEFDQMFVEHLFSRYKRARPRPETLVYADGTEAQVFFSPEDDALYGAVLPFINSARRTLDLGLFFLTDRTVADAIVRAARRGVAVRVIYDAVAAATPSSLHQYLRDNGVTVRVETWGGKMHMKGGVADGRNVLIGSMNWSDAGSDQNDENTLWVRGNKDLAMEVEAYIDELWRTLPARSERFDARAEGHDSVNSCADGIDNDFDGLIDDADTGCR